MLKKIFSRLCAGRKKEKAVMTMSRKTGRKVSAMWVAPLRRSTIVYVTRPYRPSHHGWATREVSEGMSTNWNRRIIRTLVLLQQADSSYIDPISTGGQFVYWSYLNRRTVRTLVLPQQADSSYIGHISTGGQFVYWSYLNRRTIRILVLS